ncbi:MAG TPA: PEP-CTERM system TPR-repeat protein PrsT, partial [Rhodoferax sp.]|nr:PEP-CTERM system TPR-repeat protein PrsT [Rhodoferax sp.]
MKFNQSNIRTASAAVVLSLLLGACSEKPEAMLSSAKDYLAKKDNKAAVIQIKNALQVNPDLPEARFLLGSALLDGGDPIGAATELRKALALKYPPDALLPLLAQALVAQGQAKKLIDELAGTELTDPLAKASFQTTLATAYAMQGKAELSQAALSAALQAAPSYAPAMVAKARQMAVNRDFEGAMALTEETISKNPNSVEAWKLKGDLLRYLKSQLPQALVAYRKTVEIKPDFLAGQGAVITILLQQDNLAEAATQVEGLKKIAPNHPQTKYLEAQLAFQKKEYKPARELIQQVLKVAPNNIQSLQLAGAVELQLNSLVQAEVYLSKALQALPDLALARRLLVMIYLRSGQTAKAIATLQPGLNRESVDPDLYAVAGEVYLQSGDAKKAETFFALASKQDPGNARTRTSLALTRLAGGQVETAFDELHTIAASDPGTTADLALISVHLRRGEFDKALTAIDSLEKKQADKPLAANLRGRTLLVKKDLPGARKSFERALVIDPGFFPAVASLAGLDLAEKKPDAAKKRFEAVLLKDPKNPQALLALADLAARSGAAKDEVAKLIGNAVNANPTDVPPRLLLTEFHRRNKDIKLALSAAQDAVAALPN